MKIVALAGSIVGSKQEQLRKMVEMLQEKYPQHEVTLLDLADYQLVLVMDVITLNMKAIQNM